MQKAMEPFGLALNAYWEGNKSAKIIFHRDDGTIRDYHVDHCFRKPEDFSDLEKQALEMCFGKVLDLGAGVGPHSLQLQEKGLEVYAMDISKEACEIMEKRGVLNVLCSDIYGIQKENFDTILLMGRVIGFVEDLASIAKFFNHCENLLSSKGMILLDSLDVRVSSEPDHLAYQERNKTLGRYIGVVGLQLEYNGQYSEPFKLLHLDPDTLHSIAEDTGWKCKILRREESGDYLAKISK
ncbi:MAG: class I SAM-dependent methyltransferase [Candidatus Lokiarchaeota archaeon]|nr:class I SAM-dependent methyltransferase [Candidatus Lokiarchaeota archaeon]